MVHEDKIEKFQPQTSNLVFHLKPMGWYEKMTMADSGWSIRRYLELTIIKIEENLSEGKMQTYDSMNEELWRKLTTEQGRELKDKCMDLNGASVFPKSDQEGPESG